MPEGVAGVLAPSSSRRVSVACPSSPQIGRHPVRAPATPSGLATCPQQRRDLPIAQGRARDEPGAILRRTPARGANVPVGARSGAPGGSEGKGRTRGDLQQDRNLMTREHECMSSSELQGTCYLSTESFPDGRSRGPTARDAVIHVGIKDGGQPKEDFRRGSSSRGNQ
jgi:hypothetical protein